MTTDGAVAVAKSGGSCFVVEDPRPHSSKKEIESDF